LVLLGSCSSIWTGSSNIWFIIYYRFVDIIGDDDDDIYDDDVDDDDDDEYNDDDDDDDETVNVM
jgi:hypothetical protein